MSGTSRSRFDGLKRRPLSERAVLVLLVLDEQLAGKKLLDALEGRGLAVKTLGDFGVTGRPDPDVVRRVDEAQRTMWVLVTMDLTIVEDHPGFDWNRYAIAWVRLHEGLRGAAVEKAKHHVIHQHVIKMLEQGRGDHHTYAHRHHSKSRPSLSAQFRRKL